MMQQRGRRTATRRWGVVNVTKEDGMTAQAERLLGLCGASVRATAREGTVLVAQEGGEVVGVAVLRLAAPDAEIVALATDPTVRHRGIGRRLVEEMARRARIGGCSRLRVRIRRVDDATTGFFRALGFDDTHVALDLPL